MTRRRWARTGGGFLIVTTLLTSCTSNSGGAAPASSSLTLGGTAYSLPSTALSAPSVAAEPSAPTSSSFPPSTSSSPSSTEAQPTYTSSRPSASIKASLSPKPTVFSSGGLPVVSTTGLSAQELDNRAAIEAVWITYWRIYTKINDVPAEKRLASLNAVSVDPIKGKIVRSALQFDKKGLNTYGNVAHRIYWGPLVNNSSPAIMGDCLDTSKYGTLISKTNSKQTVGYPRDNTRGIFIRGSDGRWRVQSVESLVNQIC